MNCHYVTYAKLSIALTLNRSKLFSKRLERTSLLQAHNSLTHCINESTAGPLSLPVSSRRIAHNKLPSGQSCSFERTDGCWLDSFGSLLLCVFQLLRMPGSLAVIRWFLVLFCVLDLKQKHWTSATLQRVKRRERTALSSLRLWVSSLPELVLGRQLQSCLAFTGKHAKVCCWLKDKASLPVIYLFAQNNFCGTHY